MLKTKQKTPDLRGSGRTTKQMTTMLETSAAGSTTVYIVPALASSSYFLDLLEKLAREKYGNISIARQQRAVFAPGGRSFIIVGADVTFQQLAGYRASHVWDHACYDEPEPKLEGTLKRGARRFRERVAKLTGGGNA